jgi:hypothetical protein
MTDFAWLIEAPGARYLAVRQLSSNKPDFTWTMDANKALRFWSKEQADLTAGGVRALQPDLWGFALTLGEAWPREHGFVSLPTSERKPTKMLVDQEWLTRHVTTDPDVDCEAGGPTSEVPSDLDRAWRAVDALGGTHATDKREWGVGYDEALALACAEIEKLGGRPS